MKEFYVEVEVELLDDSTVLAKETVKAETHKEACRQFVDRIKETWDGVKDAEAIHWEEQ